MDEVTKEDKRLPDCFPPTTRKFVESRTGEIIYLKETGEAFYQRSKVDPNLVLIQDLRQLTLKDSPMSVSSLTLQPDMTQQQKQHTYNAVSFPVPLNPIHKKYD